MDTTIMDAAITGDILPQSPAAIPLAKAPEDFVALGVIDFEKTPEFEAWRASKLQEWSDYLKNNWRILASADKLVLLEQGSGFPNPENRKAYAMIGANNNYMDPVTQKTAINPATNRPMTYGVWRPLGTAPTESAEFTNS